MQSSTLGLAAIAGISTSIGPCVAPRYVAIVSTTAGRPFVDRLKILGAFVVGVMLGYWLIATIASFAARALSLSPALYWALAATLVASGMFSLVSINRCHHDEAMAPRSLGGMFLLGAAGSLIVSPCCTPMLTALGAMTAGEPLSATLAILSFSLGHVAPLFIATFAAGALRQIPKSFSSAMRMTTAGLTIALGCYYAVLA